MGCLDLLFLHLFKLGLRFKRLVWVIVSNFFKSWRRILYSNSTFLLNDSFKLANLNLRENICPGSIILLSVIAFGTRIIARVIRFFGTQRARFIIMYQLLLLAWARSDPRSLNFHLADFIIILVAILLK